MDPSITTTDSIKSNDNIEGMVDDLNHRYLNGKPSNDYGEAGLFLHMLDGFCDPFDISLAATCDYNLEDAPSKSFFGGTIDNPNNLATSLISDVLTTPKSNEYGDSIYVFPPGFGPAAGLIFSPCAAEKVNPTSIMYHIISYIFAQMLTQLL